MTKKIAYLGTAGHVPDPDRFDNVSLLRAVGANSGNLMFQLAADRILGGEHHHLGFATGAYGDARVRRNLDFFVFPAANMLRADADWSDLVGFFKTIKAPLIILGLGAQAKTDADPEKVARQVGKNRTVADLVTLLKERAALITVRGPFTEAVCHHLGLDQVVRTGCPSQFLNPDSNLGQSLREQLEAGREGPIATTGNAPNEIEGWKAELESKLFGWTAATGGTYVQQSCETWIFDGPEGRLSEMDEGGYNYLRIKLDAHSKIDNFDEALRSSFRIFFSAPEWIEDVGRHRAAIGTRIHGNMAALAAGRPGILIAHDARVTELAEEMEVPRVSFEAVRDSESFDDLLPQVAFDATRFDEGRRQRAKLLVDHLDALELPPSKHLLALAKPRQAEDV
ncbi:MAG: polysaccharide pyruvyl transferase family protein [Ahrensia sp.]|nr:polysaccharide pyruvyl transferase family protein [Ahrensia sp.]